MNIKSLSIALLISLNFAVLTLESQTLYQFYDSNGKTVEFEEIIQQCNQSDMVFFGELHNNPVAHWVSVEIVRGMSNPNGQLYFGLEMFERDQQNVLDDLNNGFITLSDLEKYTRTWPNYDTDYKPILEEAVQHDYKVIATNIPRQYASFVYKHGLDSLFRISIDKSLIPDNDFIIDTTLVTYAALIEMAQSMGAGHGDHNFVSAQAVKDKTMAESSLGFFSKGDKLFHLNGAYHSKNREGIIWYILQDQPELGILSIQSIETPTPEIFEPQEDNASDFYLFINENITKSYE